MSRLGHRETKKEMEALPMGFEISEEVSISFKLVMVIAENKVKIQ